MRFTDKAAAVSLETPAGLSPSLIGKVITVQVFMKSDGRILPEKLVKYVGILKTYVLSPEGMWFTLEGNAEKNIVTYKSQVVEFIVFEGT